MTTKTAKTAAELAAELRAAADEAERQAAAEEAERQAAERELRRRRRAIGRQWWREHSASYSERWRGRVDAAWQAFAESVRTGEGNPAHLFAEFRRAVVAQADDMQAIRRATYTADAKAHEAITTELAGMAARGELLTGAAQSERAEFNAEAAKLLGENIDPDTDPQVTANRLRQAIPPPPKAPSPVFTTRGPHTFGEAVDRVVAELERETRAQAEADRAQERAAYVDSHLDG